MKTTQVTWKIFTWIYQFLCSQNCEIRIFFAQNMPETIDLSPICLSVDRRWNYWLEFQPTRVPDICPSTDAETIWLESQPTRILDVCPSTDGETIWLESQLYVLRLTQNCWLTSQPSVLKPSKPLMTHVLDVCPPTVTEAKMSPFFCTAQN